MLKILFMIHDLSVGGAEKVLVNLVNNMDKSKFDITVCALFGGGINEQFLKPHIKFYTVWKKPIPGNSKLMKLMSPKKLHKLCVKEHYDIEISYLEGSTARIISGCSDKETKLISWIHIEQHTKECVSIAFRSFEEAERCYKKFDRTVCVSEYVKNDFTSLVKLEKTVDILYNTNETAMIIEQSKELVEDGIFNDNEIKIIGIGKIKKNKGFDRLARIHKSLLADGLPVHTYILGTGQQQNEIQSYIVDNHLENSFTFLGYHTNPYKYLSKCDLFVCTSFSEGFSTAATEALILGVPVCTVEVSGMKEMLGENNEYGIVTDNTEEALYAGMKKMITAPGLLEQYAAKASERGKVFSTEKTVKAVEYMLLNV